VVSGMKELQQGRGIRENMALERSSCSARWDMLHPVATATRMR